MSDVNPSMPPEQAVLNQATRALAIEAQALSEMRDRLQDVQGPAGQAFVQAVRTVLACRGRLVVMGMGKSGHVGRKIAATLASTGTPAMFVHPAEAHHGDLGMVRPGDVVLAISNSGESEELTALLPVIKRQGIALLAMTGKPGSALARHADVVLDSAVALEACPLNLAPTASTTAQMALGDALAVTLLDVRGFKPEDFARSHPGGSLGPKTNLEGKPAPKVAIMVKYNNATKKWEDEKGRDWSKGLLFTLPDKDVFAVDANNLSEKKFYQHVGTTLFNMAVNPATGALYVSNTEANNMDRFEGSGKTGQTLQGHIAMSRVTVIKGDSVLLSQVLFNLLDNAAKYSSPGGRIEIEALKVGDRVEITVRDEGPGIAADQLEVVLDFLLPS